jgi:hypothetical protein
MNPVARPWMAGALLGGEGKTSRRRSEKPSPLSRGQQLGRNLSTRGKKIWPGEGEVRRHKIQDRLGPKPGRGLRNPRAGNEPGLGQHPAEKLSSSEMKPNHEQGSPRQQQLKPKHHGSSNRSQNTDRARGTAAKEKSRS